MSKALTINGYELVVSIVAENLTAQKTIARLGHNLRESIQAKHIKYLRSSSKANRYFIQNQFGSLVDHGNTGLNHDEIKAMVDKKMQSFIKDYEIQQIVDKNGRAKKRTMQKKATPFIELLISFGTTRPKAPKEGLNKDEANFINSLDLKNQAIKFVMRYCIDHNVECIALACHMDEKVMHFQIVCTNYDYARHACIRRNKAEMRDFGIYLQNLVARCYDGIAARGVKGSAARHKSLKQMHADELEFKNEEELKRTISLLVNKTISKFVQKDKTLFQKEYYKIELDQYCGLINSITKVILDKIKDDITITSKSELQSKIEELTNQLIDKGEIISKNKELEQENTKLAQVNQELEVKNKALQQTNDSLNSQDELIKQQQIKIERLSIENTNKTNELSIMQGFNQKVAEKNSSLNEQVIALKNKNLQLEAKAADLDKTKQKLTKIEKDNAYKNGIIDKLTNDLTMANTKADRIDELEADMVSYKDKNSELQKNLSEKDTAIKRLESKILQQESQILDLKAFKQKAIGFIAKIAKVFLGTKDYLVNDLPEIYDEVHYKITQQALSDQNFSMGDR